ncbi:hypothetical protein T02_3619 [Trichinella nativa]|uniref:Uncharacterized protein n=1 Tax=Trichinella nativa TaxID=6335 RepID=A0A0V1LRP7_9BILA|nr:hypothetical protein T06_4145 [Trichinella sp. T6]KRZ61790.1 hypothetical protein T02_3619 [Trichinella nativa]
MRCSASLMQAEWLNHAIQAGNTGGNKYLFQLVENGTTFNSFYPSAHERLPVYFLMLLQPSVVDIRRIVTEQPHEAI